MKELKEKLAGSIEGGTFTRAVLSSGFGKGVKKLVYTLKDRKGAVSALEEKFTDDGKVLHTYSDAEGLADLIVCNSEDFRQTDIYCKDFTAVALRSRKGALHIKYGKGREAPEKNGDEKNYILSPGEKYDFLVLLDIQDQSGRVKDKRQSKFRQINRFLEIVSDTLPSLPAGELTVWDLCCGKSYLSFAVYYYFRYILERDVTVYCVDRKADVMEYCSKAASSLGWDGMRFICGDITKCLPDGKPDLVLSLHACDTATDVVLSEAVKAGAKVILSSPCCQHELSTQLKSDDLSFVLREPVLKQKLAAIFTDALRCRLLYACGYKVTALEFIDPDETPKNLMIRAEKTVIPKKLRGRTLEEYDETCEKMSLRPTMRVLLDDYLYDLIERKENDAEKQ
ncbi:MAG: SAM-dependent methyltransferase [Clostridia bacterium]|nr:SAM-dependent methyltransferase [Clostridia bacterium]